MLAVVYTTSFAGIWIGISATTLATTFLVGFSGGKTALEAAWKYLILCSFGIAIALIGILLLGRAALEQGEDRVVIRVEPEALVPVHRPGLGGEAEPLEQEEARGEQLRGETLLGLQNSFHVDSHFSE